MPRLDEPKLAAFRRLLDDAHQGGQAKVDALVALSQRTVFVVPWPGGVEGWRSLVNSEGVAALPIFSHETDLEEAARRYGWLDARGEVPHQEVGARAAFNYAIRENLTFVVLDIASPHTLEIPRAEFEPLVSAAARRDSGPYAAAGRISSSLIRAVRPTPPPGSLRAPSQPPAAIVPPVIQPPTQPAPSPTASGSSPGITASADFAPSAAATFGGGTSITVAPLAGEPSDALVDALSTVLRGYPEVEWACLFQAGRGPSALVPAVGVRVDTGFRQRVNEIIAEVRRAGDAQGAALDVVMLDDATLMRTARGQGLVFYPWRK